MVDITSNIRLVDFGSGKRGTQKTEKRQTPDSQPKSGATSPPEHNFCDKVILQFPKGRGADCTGEIPTREEADNALQSLVRDLPNARQDLGRVHEFADRRRVMTLLSPLVED